MILAFSLTRRHRLRSFASSDSLLLVVHTASRRV